MIQVGESLLLTSRVLNTGFVRVFLHYSPDFLYVLIILDTDAAKKPLLPQLAR
jgi:hypothetical protein